MIASSPIYVVSGLPRSGTSLLMQILTAGGLEPLSDQTRVADDSNPRGYFEYEPVKRLASDQSWLAQAEGKVLKIIVQLLRHLPLDHIYRVIWVERAIDEVLASQAKMLGRSASPALAESLATTFCRQAQSARQWLETKPNFSTLVVQHRELITNPQPVIDRIAEFLAPVPQDTGRMRMAIDPALYRIRSGPQRPQTGPE